MKFTLVPVFAAMLINGTDASKAPVKADVKPPAKPATKMTSYVPPAVCKPCGSCNCGKTHKK